MMIVLNVTYIGDKTNEFVDEIISSGLKKAIESEQGNKQYEYFKSLDDPSKILLVEHWSNAYDLSRHSQGENIKKIGELKDKYGVTSDVLKFIIND